MIYVNFWWHTAIFKGACPVKNPEQLIMLLAQAVEALATRNNDGIALGIAQEVQRDFGASVNESASSVASLGEFMEAQIQGIDDRIGRLEAATAKLLSFGQLVESKKPTDVAMDAASGNSEVK
jgi:hypothetical protein